MPDEIDIWFGGGYGIDYRLPFVDKDEPDLRCIKPIKGHVIALQPGRKALALITDSEWLKLRDRKKPYCILISQMPPNGLVGSEEYAWSYGEIILKDNIQDEKWFSNYSDLMDLYSSGDDIETLYQKYLVDYKCVFNKECPDREQILRWAVLIIERAGSGILFGKDAARFIKNMNDVDEIVPHQKDKIRGI